MTRILIVEDDPAIGDMLEEALTQAGYQTLRAYSGTEALLAIPARRPDLMLLDLMLPGLSGEEVLKQTAGIPVIVLSAKNETSLKAETLLAGAVDYMTKPFEIRELLARIVVALRKGMPGAALTCGSLRLEEETRSVRVGEKRARLTRTEYAILKLLMRSPAQIMTKTQLLDHLSLDTPDGTEGSLKTHISNLRRKLRALHASEDIETVWGIGFRLTAGKS